MANWIRRSNDVRATRMRKRLEAAARTQLHSSTEFYARCACFALGLTTNLGVDALLVEMPHLVQSLPEGWNLPAALSLTLHLANTCVLLLSKALHGRTYRHITLVLSFLFIAKFALCIMAAIAWLVSVKKANSFHFLAATFILATSDFLSKLVFYDYAIRINTRHVDSMRAGSLASPIISLMIAWLQGPAKEDGPAKSSKFPSAAIFGRPSPRFSFFSFMLAIATIQFVFFLTLPLLESSDRRGVDRRKRIRFLDILLINSCGDSLHKLVVAEEILEEDAQSIESMCTSRPNFKEDSALVKKSGASAAHFFECCRTCFSKTEMFLSNPTLYLGLLVMNTIQDGLLPGLTSYSMLPYGQTCFFLGSVLIPFSGPFAYAAEKYFHTSREVANHFVGTMGLLMAVSIMITASFSPCPMFHHSTGGTLFILVQWLTGMTMLSHCQQTIILRLERTDIVMYLAFLLQFCTMLFGAVPVYLATNTYKTFHSNGSCMGLDSLLVSKNTSIKKH